MTPRLYSAYLFVGLMAKMSSNVVVACESLLASACAMPCLRSVFTVAARADAAVSLWFAPQAVSKAGQRAIHGRLITCCRSRVSHLLDVDAAGHDGARGVQGVDAGVCCIRA